MRRSSAVAFVCLSALWLSGCAQGGGDEPAPAPAPTALAPSSAAPSGGPATESPAPRAEKAELESKAVKHTVRSSDLTVDITYTPLTPVSTWTADGQKPLQVAVSLRNRKKPKQKIYLNRAIARFAVDDGSDDLTSPDPVGDTSIVEPGYLVTAPARYVQIVVVPTLDTRTQQLTVDLNLEFVQRVSSKSGEFTKQSVTDSVTASLDL